MEYLVDCECSHDLEHHDSSGCRGSRGTCGCRRTKFEALNGAIDLASVNPWASYLRTAEPERDDAAGAA